MPFYLSPRVIVKLLSEWIQRACSRGVSLAWSELQSLASLSLPIVPKWLDISPWALHFLQGSCSGMQWDDSTRGIGRINTEKIKEIVKTTTKTKTEAKMNLIMLTQHLMKDYYSKPDRPFKRIAINERLLPCIILCPEDSKVEVAVHC